MNSTGLTPCSVLRHIHLMILSICESLIDRMDTHVNGMLDVLDVCAPENIGANHRRSSYANRVCAVGLVLADIIAFAVSVVIASIITNIVCVYILKREVSPININQLQHMLLALTGVFCILAVQLFARGQYRERVPVWSELGHLCIASVFSALIMGFSQFSMQSSSSRPMLLGCWLTFPFLSVIIRQIVKRALDRAGLWRVPVVVITDRSGAANVRVLLTEGQPPCFRAVQVIEAAEYMEDLSDLDWASVLERCSAQRLLLSVSAEAMSDDRLIQSIMRSRVPFSLIPENDELPVFGRQETAFFGQDVFLISYRNNLSEPTLRFLKMVFDICLASVALFVLLPLMGLLALLVSHDGGPILFAHERIGEGGRRFGCLKFRTMVVDSERALREVLATDPVAAAEWAATRKLTNDPRVTRVGMVLRKTSLDELPQLFNILRLEMSLVGPRPIVEQEVPRYGEDISYYYETRPGLTGLWQVSGRSNTSYEQRVRYDKWYVKNWTAWHDLAIIIMTVPAVLKRRGAQ